MPERDGFMDGVELARRFYTAHELEITRAASKEKAKERRFEYSAERFDDWLVEIGLMPEPVRNAEDSIVRTGLAQKRYLLRQRLNLAARDGEGLPRGFSVEASGKLWRVELSEQYIGNQPTAMMDGLSRHYRRLNQNIKYVRDRARRQEHVNDAERYGLLHQVDQAEFSILWGVTQVQMALHALDPDAKIPDMSKLGRGFEKLVDEAFLGKSRQRKTKRA
jgi:hypothetical protein